MSTQLVVMTPAGRIDLTSVEDFKCRQQVRTVTVTRMDGHPLQADLPTGCGGHFKFRAPRPVALFRRLKIAKMPTWPRCISIPWKLMGQSRRISTTACRSAFRG